MKHIIISSEKIVPKLEINVAKKHIEAINAKEIGICAFEEGLIHTKQTTVGDSLHEEVSLRSEIVVMHISDYNRMMSYLDRLGDFVFYDKNTSEEVRLKDLIWDKTAISS